MPSHVAVQCYSFSPTSSFGSNSDSDGYVGNDLNTKTDMSDECTPMDTVRSPSASSRVGETVYRGYHKKS